MGSDIIPPLQFKELWADKQLSVVPNAILLKAEQF
jgi:hypothetical protein